MIVSGDTAFQTCQLRRLVEVGAREGICISEGFEELKGVRLDAERDSPGTSKGNSIFFFWMRGMPICAQRC